jgi:SWI/SNF-related matrix-associated actin-dependent regulator of chromatin subfamily A member 5
MMLDRLRRKLFLSVKVMGSEDHTADEKADLGVKELLDILRKGSSALSFQGMDLSTFLKANIEDILERSRSMDSVRDAKAKKDANVGGEDEDLLKDAEEEERRLLSGVAQVHCRVFEGKVVQGRKGNAQIASEWRELQKRARVDRTVVVNGITVISDHIAPAVEAVCSSPRERGM